MQDISQKAKAIVNSLKSNNWLLREEYKASLIEQFSFVNEMKDEYKKDKKDKTFKGIKGLLLNESNYIYDLLGIETTTYSDIIAYIEAQNQSITTEPIVIDVDSPGGAATNQFLAAMDTVKNSVRPIIFKVLDQCCSAAYMIASQGEKIQATGLFSMIGSVGVVAEYWNDDGETITITNEESPNKRPDLNTEEGRNVIVSQLDDLHDVVKRKIIDSRPNLKDSDFGRGAVFVAQKALNMGLIDEIICLKMNNLSRSNLGDQTMTKEITLAYLEADHPDLVKSIEAKAQNDQLANIKDHLALAKESGNYDYALECIEQGIPVNADIALFHMKHAKEEKQTDSSHKILAENKESEEIAAISSTKKEMEINEPETAEQQLNKLAAERI